MWFSRWFCSFLSCSQRVYSLVSTWNATSFPCKFRIWEDRYFIGETEKFNGILYFQSTRVNHFKTIYLFIQNLHIWLYFSRLCVCGLTLSCLTLCEPLGCSQTASSVQGIFQARILEWIAIFSSRGSSQPSDRTHVSVSPALQVDSVRWAIRETHSRQ